MRQIKRLGWRDQNVGNRIDWHKPIYKFVDLKDAEAVRKGSIKIGTLYGYANLSGERQDSDENSVKRYLTIDLHSDVPVHRDYMEAAGIELPKNTNIILSRAPGVEATLVTRGSDFYCCCFSSTPVLFRQMDEPYAVFLIDDATAWATEVRKKLKLGPYMCAQTRYGNRYSHIELNPSDQPSPFLKPFSNGWENEVRILWMMRDTASPYPSLGIGDEDSKLARLITRIA